MSRHAILIGDVGATSSKWALLEGEIVQYLESIGFNPRTHSPEVLKEALLPLQGLASTISVLHYYGTGVLTNSDKAIVQNVLSSTLPGVELQLSSDMLAAARSTGHSPAIVCILGTGSNSCLFDGDQVIDKIPTLGYPHGDEGSGWRIGQALVQSYYHRVMPDELAQQFATSMPADHTLFLGKLQDNPAPTRYLASFARFAADKQQHAWVQELVLALFQSFLVQHVLPYGKHHPVHCIGGIAHAFEDILRAAMTLVGLEMGSIIKNPLEGLVHYHKHKT